jgi:RimJ/RimL family protein N-acetyltransferase
VIDMEKFPLFKPFEPTEEKIMVFAKKLMEEYLYLDDTLRNYEIIHRLLLSFTLNRQGNAIYEIGDFDGILGFTDIIPGWKARLTFKLWNAERWGVDFARQAKNFLGEFMEAFHLVRLESNSPDPRIVKMAKMVGFKVEGMKRFNFSWDKQLYDDYFFSIVREED